MKLVVWVDDCPRTHRPLSINYCKETQCLYFTGDLSSVGRDCSHPKAIPTSVEETKYRLDVLDRWRNQKKGESSSDKSDYSQRGKAPRSGEEENTAPNW